VLGYLLKHAHLALEHRAQAALADVGVTVRDLGVLKVIASGEAQSQQEAAAVPGVDRTSMVPLLDALERQGIVARRPSHQPGNTDQRSRGTCRTPAGRSLAKRGLPHRRPG
jgi:DNA-binding MarR family transcriptional regulator